MEFVGRRFLTHTTINTDDAPLAVIPPCPQIPPPPPQSSSVTSLAKAASEGHVSFCSSLTV
ncbi:hypothetical protein E2C01_059257 [Portunus trituberculatus]|uniref:Uncharacterized protein n=1 Tax=Portunus trituberculatus TaxID=210409 RepID=A0A5B7H5K5_PORTR|nr:hypothetical protein [Portunus trituberculatus]